MSARTRSLVGVVIMSLLLLMYFWFVVIRAVALLQTGTVIAVAMGVALIVLPLVGFWALYRELAFGYASTKLVDRLEAEGLTPEEDIETLPSGRPVREQADDVFPQYKDEVLAHEDSWQAWMRLGIIYDACGDRRRARATIRKAIALEKSAAKS